VWINLTAVKPQKFARDSLKTANISYSGKIADKSVFAHPGGEKSGGGRLMGLMGLMGGGALGHDRR
jgi:hypothetical protein